MSPVIIIGAEGQDGRLLQQSLASNSQPVVPIGRKTLDILDQAAVNDLISTHNPSALYYLAAHHHSAEATLGRHDAELFTKSFQVHVTGLINCLEAIGEHSPSTRAFYAASSHVFGMPKGVLQDENTPIRPTCIYGITKAAGVDVCRYYRDTRGLFVCTGFLYNHESPFRRKSFVSQKIIQGALEIAAGRRDHLTLGSLSSRVDWGYAPDFVEAMQRILANDKAEDFVVATGETHSVQEFVEIVFAKLGLDWSRHVSEAPSLITKQQRVLSGNAAKLRAATGWRPSVSFRQMVELLLSSQSHAV